MVDQLVNAGTPGLEGAASGQLVPSVRLRGNCGRSDGRREVGHDRRERIHGSPSGGAHEVRTRRNDRAGGLDRGKRGPESTANAIAHHRVADTPPDGVRDPYLPWRPGRDMHDREGTATGAPTMNPQVKEGCPVTEGTNQADSLDRPRRRRPARIARPARLDMRCRKPWRLARFRTFGWNVRFTCAS